MEIFNADRPDYDKRLKSAIGQEVKVFWQSKEPMIGLFNEEQLIGVACVVSPDFGLSVGRFWQWRLKMLLSAGFVSTRQMVEKEEKLRAAIIFERYHMLAFLAIQPNHQQSGLGAQLLSAVDDLVSEDQGSAGVGVYITLDDYMEFFQGVGFEFVSDVSVGNVHGRLMFRKQSGQDPA